jgi:phosphoserine phosphatase
MFVATLLAAPTGPHLDPALAESLRNAWGGGDLQWLAPDEAAEFALAASPDNFEEVWQSLQEQAVDLVVQPAAGRRKRVLLADMDSTMIQQECIDELAAVAGVGGQVAGITARAMNGELDFEDALRERVALLRGLPERVIAEVLESRIALMPGGPELVATMRANGGYAALVSGGFTVFTGAIAARLGFDEHRANTLDIMDGELTGHVVPPILGRQAKLDALREICARLSLPEAEVLAVGDGANDLAMLQAAGSGVALHAKPAVAAQTDLRVNHGDLTALLYLQGYARDEFARP